MPSRQMRNPYPHLPTNNRRFWRSVDLAEYQSPDILTFSARTWFRDEREFQVFVLGSYLDNITPETIRPSQKFRCNFVMVPALACGVHMPDQNALVVICQSRPEYDQHPDAQPPEPRCPAYLHLDHNPFGEELFLAGEVMEAPKTLNQQFQQFRTCLWLVVSGGLRTAAWMIGRPLPTVGKVSFGHWTVPYSRMVRQITAAFQVMSPIESFGRSFWRDTLLSQEPRNTMSRNRNRSHADENWYKIWRRVAEEDALDESQREAGDHILHHRLTLVQAPPATGKTKLAVGIVRATIKAGKRALYVAASNQAIAVFENRIKKRVKETSGDMELHKMPNICRVHTNAKEAKLMALQTMEEEDEPSLSGTAIIPMADETLLEMQNAFDKFSENERNDIEATIVKRSDICWEEGPRFVEMFVGEKEILMRYLYVKKGLKGIEYVDPKERDKKLRPVRRTWTDIKQEYVKNAECVIATTSTAVASHLLRDQKFDVIVIDESSQVLEAEADAVILKFTHSNTHVAKIGDDQQLGSVVKEHVFENQTAMTLFSRLMSEGWQPLSPQIQYRMHPDILHWA